LNRGEVVDRCLARVSGTGLRARVRCDEGEEWSAEIANGEVEEISSSRAGELALRVFDDEGRTASVSTTDLTPATVDRLVDEAVALAAAGEPDGWNGLPPAELCGETPVEGLLDRQGGYDPDAALRDILAAEAEARGMDERIVASHRSGTAIARGESLLATSDGTRIEQAFSRYQHVLLLVAAEDGEKQMGVAYTAACKAADLRPLSEVAREAVDEAVGGFGWRRAPSGAVPVVFDNKTASEILGLVGGLAAGGAVYRAGTCWKERRGERVAAEVVEVVDDPCLPGELGSRACDREGVASKPLTLIRDGVLVDFHTDSYAARRLELPFTGHAGGTSNLRLRPGAQGRDELCARAGTGFLCTRLHGHGVDLAGGHWSKGAAGFWIENGRLAHPVQEVTLAGSIDDLFGGIRAVGDDPCPERTTSSPSLLVEGLHLGGE